MNCDYKPIGPIDINLINEVKDLCLAIDWKDQRFDRFEKTLLEGRLCCLPYVIVNNRQKKYTVEDQLKLDGYLEKIINQVMLYFPNYTKMRGEVATLYSGAKLVPHFDTSWFHAFCRRIHIPIYTNDKCEQIFEDRMYHLDEGMVYEINNRILHSAHNGGDEYRIHLILDLIPDQIFNSLSPEDQTFDRLIRYIPDPMGKKESFDVLTQLSSYPSSCYN